MAKTRTLHDLYVIGETVTFPVPEEQREKPDSPEWVTVYVQKLDPLDHDQAIRRAKAARARKRAVLSDLEGDEYLTLVDTVDMMSAGELIDVAVAKETQELRESGRSEKTLGEDSEWAKDGYLEGLISSWVDNDLEMRLADDPDDVDANQVLKEMARFEEELAQDLAAQLRDLREQYETMDPGELRAEALEQLIDRETQLAFVNEFVRCEVWLSTRLPCNAHCLHVEAGVPAPRAHQQRHPDYYFAGRADVERLEAGVMNRLQDAYRRIAVDPTEGKGSRATGASSASSEPSAPEETEPSSGQLAAVG